MPRTTLNIDSSILRQVKKLAKAQGKSLAQVVSELLAKALSTRSRSSSTRGPRWTTKAMGARVDLEDKEAVHKLSRADELYGYANLLLDASDTTSPRPGCDRRKGSRAPSGLGLGNDFSDP